MALLRGTKNPYRVLLCKSEGQRLFDRPTSKWENDIKMDANEEGWGRGLIHIAKGRKHGKILVNAIIDLRISPLIISRII